EATESPLDGSGSVGHAVDRTVIEELQARIEDHLAAQAAVLEHLRSAVAIFGRDQRLTFYNRAYRNLWDFDEGWLRRQPTLGEILEDLRARRRWPEHADFPAYKRARIGLFTELTEPREELLHLPDGTTLRQVTAPYPSGGLLTILEDVTSTLA